MKRFSFPLAVLFATSGWWLAAVLLTVGYVVAPLLFAELSEVAAGKLVGVLLQWSQSFVLVWLLLSATAFWFYRHAWVFGKTFVLLMLLLAINLFWLGPEMEALKAGFPEGVPKGSALWQEFMMLHGLYQLSYLSAILLLVVWGWQNLKKLVVNKALADKKSL
ncbi:DUF4149 domain-containing protein [Thiomicrorhabdus cannonii]|uniref:DUF4149 domain-containing protein n=1 Tax=Thiomicrorhabdus cannonii TaxID=2748011 RepID=UPI0015B84DC0|nr:DUF4149 domain-containing protein [Thiomicrorhabdus cannonii]